MLKRLLAMLAACAVLCAVCVSTVLAAEKEEAAVREGKVEGILIARGDTWVLVKADGEKEAQKYLPFWRGGAPKDGGGFDKEMLAAIRRIAVPSRVELVWKQEEHRRIVSIKVLAPAQKEGTVTGTVAAKGENWIEVQADGGQVERYMPKWIGGAPASGGGLDKDMMKKISGVKVGDKVEVRWIYEERLRVVELKTVGVE